MPKHLGTIKMDSYKANSSLFKYNGVGMLLVVLCCPIMSQSEIATTKQRLKANYPMDATNSLDDPVARLGSENSITSIKNDLKEEIKADLKKELLEKYFEEKELANKRPIHKEIDCKEVQQCVADDFTRINNKLIEDDIKILQNKVAMDQVCNSNF